MYNSDRNSITFNNTRYHLNDIMYEWCTRVVGPGKWTGSSPRVWEGMGDIVWTIDSAFGNTTFTFKDPQDLTLFILKWS